MSFAVNTASKLLLVDNRILQVDHSWLTHLTNNTDYLVYDFLNDSREDLENAITSLSKSFDSIGICFYNENPSSPAFQLINSMESSPVDSFCSTNDWQYTIEWFKWIVQTIQCSSIELIPYYEVVNGEDWIHIAELLASSLFEKISISNSTINSFFDISISTPYTKLLLIDDRISDIETGILSSLTHDTTYIIFNYETDTLERIKEKILAFGVNFSNVSIAQHGIFDPTYRLFSNMGEATLKDVETADPGLSTWEDYRLFLGWLKTNVQTQYFDLLACYIWNNSDWRYVIENLREDMYIRASVDITGSSGNFILESDNVDTIGVYFTREVLRYKYSFAGFTNPPTVSSAIEGFRRYKFTYNQTPTTGINVVGISYELFKNGTLAANSVRKQIFSPYEVASVSPYKSIPTDISNVNIGLSYGIKKIQIIKTLSYKRMYFLVSSITTENRALYYYEWDTNTNNWDTTTAFLFANVYSSTSCFRFTPDGTRCVLATAPPSFTGAYVYYLDYSYSYPLGTITFNTPFATIDSIQFTGCDINDDKTSIFVCYNGTFSNNSFYYSKYSEGSYGNLIKQSSNLLAKYDIICNASGTTVIINNGIYDLSGSSWVLRKSITGLSIPINGFCFGGVTRSENMILTTHNTMTSPYSIAGYSVKYFDASLSFSTLAELSNTNGEPAPGNGRKSIAFDPDPSVNGIYVVLDGNSSIYYTTLDYVTNYTTSPSPTSGTYTACNLDCGAYYIKLTVTAIDGSGAYSRQTSNMSVGVNVYDAPTAPTFTQVSQGGFNNTIKMYYTKPVSDGSRNITKYQYSLDSGTTFKTITSASGSNIITDGSYTIIDASINGGSQYIMQLRAINSADISGDIAIDSDYTTPPPYTYPDAPEVSYTLNMATGEATITSVCLYNGGSISTSYKYSVSPSYDILYDSSSGVNTFTFPSTNRTYRYYTQNASVSSLSYTSIQIQTPPLPPILSLSIITQKQIIMTYTDASYTVPGKLPITNYKYSLDNVTYTTIAYSSSGSYAIQNVTPGIRTVYLKTTNGTTDSDAAIQSIEVYSLPNYSPIITNIFHDDGTLTVTYKYNGEEYNPITTYLYSINGDISNNYVDLNTATPSPFVFTNVVEPITIYMKARNSYGDSIARSCTTSLSQPTDLYVITGNNKALVSFVPPSYVQNTITGYLYSIDYGQTYYPAIVSNDSFMVNNLISGVTYKVYLIATDVNGYGSVAVSNSFTPINDFSVSSDIKDTYGIFTITDSMAKNIEITIGGNTQTYPVLSDNTYHFGGLLNSTEYSVTVSSYNDIGELSSQTFEIKTLPSPPVITNCTVSIPQSKVTVTFNESVSNGYPVTSYKYSLDDISYTNIQFNGGVFEVGIDTSKTKKYTLYLRAVNSYNDSEASIFDFNVGNPPLTAAANLANVSCRESNKIYFEITNYESTSTYQYSITVTSGTGTNIAFTNFTAGTFISISTGRVYNIITLANNFINPTVTLGIRNRTTNNTTPFTGLFVYTNLAPSVVTVSPVNDVLKLKITFTKQAPANYKYRLTNPTSPITDFCNNYLSVNGTTLTYYISGDTNMVAGTSYSPIIYGVSGTYTVSGSQYDRLSAGVTSTGTAMAYNIPTAPRIMEVFGKDSQIFLRYWIPVNSGGSLTKNYKFRYGTDLSYIELTKTPNSMSTNGVSEDISGIKLIFKDTSQQFTIYVACDNSAGTSPDASYTFPPSNYPYKKPEPPSYVEYDISKNKLNLTVKTPMNNGNPIIKYVYKTNNITGSGELYNGSFFTLDISYQFTLDISYNTTYSEFKLYSYSASGGLSPTPYTLPEFTTAPLQPLFTINYINETPTSKKVIIDISSSQSQGTLPYSYRYYISPDISGVFNDTTTYTIPTPLFTGATYTLTLYSFNQNAVSDQSSLSFAVYYPPGDPSLGIPTQAINVLYFPFTIPQYTGGFPIQKYRYTIRSINTSNVILDTTYDSSKGLYYTNPLNELTINSYTSGTNAWNVSFVKYFQIVKSLSSTKCYVLTFPKNESVGTPQLYASQNSSGLWGTLENVSSNFPEFPTTATSFRFSRDGSYAIVGCMNDPSFCLYKYTLSNGTYIRSTISMGSLSLSHTKIDISTDGNVIASISSSGLGYSQGGNTYQMLDNTNNYTGIAVSHDGARIVVCTGTNLYVRIWDGTTYASIQQIGTTTPTNSDTITDIRYNLNSTYLFTNKYTYSIFDSSTNTHSTFNDMTRVNKLYDTVLLGSIKPTLITVDVDSSNSIYGTVSGSQTTSYVYKMFTNTFINPINYSSNPDIRYTISSFQTYNGYTYSNPVNLSENYYAPLRNGIPTDLSGIGHVNLKITFKNTSNIISGYSYKLDISGGSNTQYDVSLSSLTESSLDSNEKYTYLYIVPNTYPGNFYKIQNLKTYSSVDEINTYESDAYSISMNDYIYVYYVPTAPSFNCIGKTNSFDISLNQLSSSVDTIIRYEYSINNGIDFKPLRDSYGNLINAVGRYNNIIDPSLNYAQSYKIQIRAVTQYTTGDVGKDSNYIKILRSSTYPTQLTTDSSYQKFKINFKEPTFSGSSIIKNYRYTIQNVSGGTFTGDISANSDTYTDPSNLFQLGIYTHTGVDWNPLTYEKIQVVGDRVYVLTHNTSEATSIPRLIYYTNSGGIWDISDSNIPLKFNTNLFKFTNDSNKLIYTSMAYVELTTRSEYRKNYQNIIRIGSCLYANRYLYLIDDGNNIRRYIVNPDGNVDTNYIDNSGLTPSVSSTIMYYDYNNNKIIYSSPGNGVIYQVNPDLTEQTLLIQPLNNGTNASKFYFSSELKTLYYMSGSNIMYVRYNEGYNVDSSGIYWPNIPTNIHFSSVALYVFTLNSIEFVAYRFIFNDIASLNVYIYLKNNIQSGEKISFPDIPNGIKNILFFDTYIIIITAYIANNKIYSQVYKLYNFNQVTNTFVQEFLFDYNDENPSSNSLNITYNNDASTYYITYYAFNWKKIKYIPSNNSINLYDTQPSAGTENPTTISPAHIGLITFLDIDITSNFIAACYVENNICKLMYVDHTNPSSTIIIIDQPPINKTYSVVALSQNSQKPQYLSVAYNYENDNFVDVYTYINSVFTFTGSFFINTNMPIYSMCYNEDTTMLFASTNGTNMFFSCYVDSSGYLIGVTPYNTIWSEEPYTYSHPYLNNIPNIINQPYNSIYYISYIKYTSIDISGNSIYLFPYCKDVPTTIVPYLFKVDLTPHSRDYSFISIEKTNLAKNNGLPYVVNIKAINYDNIESSGSSINAYAYDNPSPPTFTVTPSYEKLQISFTHPVDDGSTNIIAYNYTASGYNISGTYTLQGNPITGTFDISDCIPGVSYPISLQTKSFQVDNSNQNILSVFSSSTPGTAYTLPKPPTDTTLSMIPTKEVNSFDISFNKITNGSEDAGYTTISGYKYSISDGVYTSPYIDASYHELYDGRLSFRISSINDASLSPSINYTVYLKSVNAAGISDLSSTINATNFGVPSSPMFDITSPYNGHAIGGFMKITVSFNKVTSNDPVKIYKIGVSGEEWYDEINDGSYNDPVVYQLSADDINDEIRLFSTSVYNVKLIATNSRGDSIPIIDISSITILRNPSLPKLTTFARLNSIDLSYSEPSDFGGGNPISYMYYITTDYEYTGSGEIIPDSSYIDIPYVERGNLIVNKTPLINYFVYMKFKTQDENSNIIYSKIVHPESDLSYVTPYTYPPPPDISGIITYSSSAIVILNPPPINNSGRNIVSVGYYNALGGTSTQNLILGEAQMQITELNSSYRYNYKFFSVNNENINSNENTDASFSTNPLPPIINTITSPSINRMVISLNTPSYTLDSSFIPITNYRYRYYLSGALTLPSFINTPDGSLPPTIDISGISAGNYKFDIKSFNGEKESSIFSTETIRVYTNPLPPVFESVIGSYNRIDVSFSQDITTAGTGNSGISGFYYTLIGNSQNRNGTLNSSSRSTIFNNIPAGNGYQLTLQTINSDGAYSTTNINTTDISVYTTPASPTFNQFPLAGNMNITFSFTPPFYDGNTPITGYQYAIQKSGDIKNPYIYVPTASAEQLITISSIDLSYGYTYTVYVRAINLAGESTDVSATTFQSVYSYPDVPSINSCIGGLNSIYFQFNEPYNRGRDISSYMYSLNSAEFKDIGIPSDLSYTITHPPDNILYGQVNNIRLLAINPGGSGEIIDFQTTFNPYTYPPPPNASLSNIRDKSCSIQLTSNGDGGNPFNSYWYTDGGTPLNYKDLTDTSNVNVTFTDLSASTQYSLNFYTKNQSGVYSTLPTNFTFITRPEKPTPIITTTRIKEMTFRYTIPQYDVPLTKYKYYVTNDISGEVDASNTPINISGIPAGNYTFTMQVYNDTWYSEDFSQNLISVYDNPSPPSINSFTASYESIDFSVSPPSPTNMGNSDISGYLYSFSSSLQEVPFDSSYTFTDTSINHIPLLTPGIPIYLFVRVTNQKGGISDPSRSNITVPPYTLPSIAGITLTRNTNTPFSPKIDVSFNADNNSGYTPTTSYQYSVNGISYTPLLNITIRSFTINTSQGTIYDISMIAVNVAGQSSPINAIITQYEVPSPPSFNGTTVGGYNKITFSFNSSTVDPNTQIDVVKYQYSIDSGTTYIDISNQGGYVLTGSYEITPGVTAGQYYTVNLRSFNNIGYSSPVSDTSSVLVYTTPGIPSSIITTASFESIEVSYTPPVLDGSNAIYKYQYVVRESSIPSSPIDACYNDVSGIGTFTITDNIKQIIGLSYDIYVRAVNAAGGGVPIKSTSTVTPYTYPQPPTIINITPSYNNVSYLLTAPVNTGYTPITGYYYKENTSDLSYKVIPGGDVGGYKSINDLSDSTAYKYYVYSKNVAGYSLTSTDLSFTTLPSSPTIQDASCIFPNQISILCEYPSNPPIEIISFRFEVWQTDLINNPTIKISDSSFNKNPQNRYVIENIPQYTKYALRAFSYNGINESIYSETKNIDVFTTPSPPILGTLTAGKESITFSFTPISTSGGRNISGYKYSTDNFVTSTNVTTSPVTFSGTPGIPVNVEVKSINNEGFDSSYSNTFGNSVIPYTNPSPPTITQITPTYVNNQNTFIIYYTASASGYRPINNYYYSTDSGSTYTEMGVTTDGSYTIPTSFSLGTTYNFQIKSQNSVGLNSSGSNIIVSTSLNVPSSPSIVSLSGGYEKILFRFLGSSLNGGTPIIKYQYSISGETLSSLQDISSGGQYQMSGDYIINNVTAGKNYHLYLYASNIVGNSSPDISGNVMAYTKPYAPTINTNTITTSTSGATVTIIEPANSEEQGYSPITYYSYREYGTTEWTDVSYTSGNMTLYIYSLPPSKTYTYQIAAKNIADYSNTTDISFTTNPLPPTITNITASYESIDFTFTASTTNGNNLSKHSVAIRDISANEITNYVDMSSSQNSGTYNVNITMFTSSQLTVGKNYSILLKCTNQAGKESTTTESSTSVVPYTLPNTPSFELIGTTSTSIGFRIGSLSSPYNGYSEIQNYYYYHKGVQYSCTPNTDISLNDLSSSTLYQIGRSATNAAGTSLTVNESVVTNPGTLKLAVTPRRISLDISYSLESPLNEGTADSSGFYYSISGGTYSVETYIVGSDSANTGIFNIPSLTAGTPYQIKLVKKLKNGKISPDKIFYDSSIYPYTYASPPRITGITGLSSSSLHIDFISPSSLYERGYTTVKSYTYDVNSNGISSEAQIPNMNDTSFNLISLSAGTTYSIRMLTSNTAGDGSYSTFFNGYTLPNPPYNISAVANGDRMIRVVYSEPTNGDVPIIYQYALDSGEFRTMGNSPHDISGLYTGNQYTGKLIAGHEYTLYFRSTNTGGSSSIYTYSPTVIPYTLPDAPIFDSLIQSGIGQLRIIFSPPTPLLSFKPISYYYYLAKNTETGSDISRNVTPTNYDISGLTPGTYYEITLYSVNGAGQTESVNKRTLTPYTTPSSITNTIDAGHNKIIVSITSPTPEQQGYDINGIIRYEYTLDNETNYSELIINELTENYEITGLTAGQQYNIRLRSVNRAGNSPQTDPTTIIPYTIPNAPSFTTEPNSPTLITVRYTPYINGSFNAGYTTISRYEYSINNGVSYITAPSSQFDISGLFPSTDYTIRMRSLNAAGYSLGDTSSNTTTISAIPTIVSAVPSINSIIVKYKASTLNGTSYITSYKITLTNISTQNETIYNISGGAEGAGYMYTYTISDISATNYNVNLQTLNKSQKYSEKTPDSFSSVYTYPSSPTINYFTSTTNIVTVHFVASNSDGNSSPLTYWYSIDTDTSNIETTTKNPMTNPEPSYNPSTGVYTYQLTNLTKYTPYYVALYAKNAADVFSRLETGKSKIMFLNGSYQDISINTLPIIAIPVFPTNTLTATAYRNSVQLNFDIPTNTGFTGYRYTVINTTTGSDILNHTLNSAIQPIVISGLAAGTPILIRLTAYNSFGDSITLESNPVTPYQPPNAIPSITITPIQDSQIYRAEFTHPFDGGSQITGYYYKFTNQTLYTELSPPTTSFIFNPTNNDALTITMYATNIAGDSLSTNQTLGARTIPDSPAISLLPQPSGFAVTITKPDNDGNAPITGYKFSINNQPFDINGQTYYELPTDSSKVDFSLRNGDILTDINGIQRTISIETNISYTIKAIATNRLGDSVARDASGYSYGTPSSPTINGITFVENAILIYFNEGNPNGSTTLGLKYSLNEQPYTYIANNNFSTISPLVIYTTPNVDFTIKLITVSNNGDSIPVISNAVNIPDPYSSNIRQTISSGDKIEALNTLALMNDMLETEHGAIESDNNTNIMKFVNNIQDFTSSISAQGSLQNIPLHNDPNIRLPYPNKATILVRKYYQKQLNKKST